MNGDLMSMRAFLSLAIVLALLGLTVWTLRRGALRLPLLKARTTIVVETATSLGERRSLAIVNVEGRRLLLGLTPHAVSHIADLPPGSAGTADGRGVHA